jgi:bis(5'-nucleosyl)-tetraphosphatase (symmetrical)
LGYALVHAGLPVEWDIDTAMTLAHEVETLLRGSDYRDLLANMYGNQPDRWSDSLAGHDRARFIINCFTRMRYCDSDGRLDLEHKGPPGTQPDGLTPWFEIPGRASANQHILFGHWSTLGEVSGHNVYPLDTGCLWGGHLTAMRIDEKPYIKTSIACPEAQKPKLTRQKARR